jgi:hypothetical protein
MPVFRIQVLEDAWTRGRAIPRTRKKTFDLLASNKKELF